MSIVILPALPAFAVVMTPCLCLLAEDCSCKFVLVLVVGCWFVVVVFLESDLIKSSS